MTKIIRIKREWIDDPSSWHGYDIDENGSWLDEHPDMAELLEKLGSDVGSVWKIADEDDHYLFSSGTEGTPKLSIDDSPPQ